MFVILGASLDGVYNGKIVEIKCPYVLADKQPSDLQSLTKQQRNKYFCEESSPGVITLKQNHPYFTQVQIQMALTGFETCYFVV